MEMFPDIDVDPCELFFRDYREVDGRQFPGTIEVRFGEQSEAKLHLDALVLRAEEEPTVVNEGRKNENTQEEDAQHDEDVSLGGAE